MMHTIPLRRLVATVTALLVGLAFASQALAAEWYQQYTLAGQTFYDVASYSPLSVAVGSSGNIIYTTDGDTWNSAASGTGNHLYAVDVLSSTIAYAVGFNGTVTRTLNGGSTWSTLASGTSNDLWATAFVDKKTGIIAGESGTIMQTTDGATFVPRSTGTNDDLIGAHAADASTIYVVGQNGRILVSTNKGMGWSSMTSNTVNDLYDVWCDSAVHCYAVGEAGTVQELNEGVWSDSGIEIGIVAGLSIDGYDANHFMIGAGDEALYTTADAGATWSQVDFAEGTPVHHGVSYVSNDMRFVAGEDVNGDAVVWRHDGYVPTNPTNFTVQNGTPTADTTPTFTWGESLDVGSGMANYVLIVDDGAYVGVTTDTDFTFVSAFADGTHAAELTGYDGAGNATDTLMLDVVVDTVQPTVGTTSPISAVTNSATTFRATATDATSGIASCTLAINGLSVGTMTHVGSGIYERDYTFTSAGAYSVFTACLDEADNARSGAVTNVTVSVGAVVPTPTPEPTPTEGEGADSVDVGILIKTPCSEGAGVNDACKAVYWYGDDGMRHAFPNEKVFFTWFANFDSIALVTPEFMATIPLGRNVTYRPGIKMVKFPSLVTVYVVEAPRTLRAIPSETVASDLYGTSWNAKIDDVSEAFYFNYTFGTALVSASDFNVGDAVNSVDSLNDIF